MTHVRTSPYYPQSNGKIERWHKTLKGECIRVKMPLIPGRRPADRRRISWLITTTSACTAPSATSRPRTSWPAATGRSSPSGTASWMRRESGGRPPARRVEPVGDRTAVEPIARPIGGPYDERWPGRRIGLRGDTTRAPTQGPRPKGGGTMPPCLSPSGLARRRQIDASLIQCTVYLISRPRFLHFTLETLSLAFLCRVRHRISTRGTGRLTSNSHSLKAQWIWRW